MFVVFEMQLIERLLNRQDLSEEEAEASLDFLLSNGSEALISAFLVLLRAKGETFEEVIQYLLLVMVLASFGPKYHLPGLSNCFIFLFLLRLNRLWDWREQCVNVAW